MNDDNIVLEVSNLSKYYGETQILEGVSLSVAKGEIFGMIGANGAGKTTLIKVILDLAHYYGGSIELFGTSHKDGSFKKNIAYLPEKFTPSPLLKGREFLSLSGSYYGQHYSEELAIKALEELEMDKEVLRKRIGKYSKGMGQKLGLAAVFLTGAQFLILDEPMSGLDPMARISLKKKMEFFVKGEKRGNAILFSSHILSDVEEICDRIAIMHNKKAIYVGTVKNFILEQKAANLEEAFVKATKKG